MSAWDLYKSRMNAQGGSKRNAVFLRESRYLSTKLGDSLSYHEAIVDGELRNVAIINSDNLEEKTMLSLPGEDFDCGVIVEWMDNRWLVTEKDANNELYTKVKLVQCNYLLRWVDDDDVIHEQWCIIEDGTKLRNSFRVEKSACKNYLSNCWKLLKLFMLQRNVEQAYA